MPEELKKLIVEMASANVSWGEERIAQELLGLDPVSWTLSERRIRCPQWQRQRSPGDPAGSFDDEFKAGAVRLVLDEGQSVGRVARELDLTESAFRNWSVRPGPIGRRAGRA